MNDYRRNNRDQWKQEMRQRWESRHGRSDGRGHIWTGLFLLLVGGVALARSFGVIMPAWLFTWQMFLIAIGLFIGIRKGFRGGWFVPVLIGGVFWVNEFVMLGDLRRHLWPLILIVIGLVFVFRPRKRKWGAFDEKKTPPDGRAGMSTEPEVITPIDETSYSQDDYIDSTSIFGSDKKMILSKNFKGGDIVNIFGGSEIDFTQADINGVVILEITALFGGATLLVPSHWIVRSEAVTIFGGISDKRKITNYSDNSGKTIVIKGTVIFGGIEVKSY